MPRSNYYLKIPLHWLQVESGVLTSVLFVRPKQDALGEQCDSEPSSRPGTTGLSLCRAEDGDAKAGVDLIKAPSVGSMKLEALSLCYDL